MALLQAQVTLPPDINLFGDDLPQQGQRVRRGGPPIEQSDQAKPPAAGYAQALIFGDGRVLHGELVEVTADEILWRRPDVAEPLRFPRSEVRRIVTGVAPPEPRNVVPAGGFMAFFTKPVAERVPDKPIPATLKLPGGDWLFGNVTSADGQSFAVKLDDGTQLAVSRPQIEWMQFGQAPVPAFGFSGAALDMEGWSPPSAAMELAAQTLVVNGSAWIGRSISPPKRFEVSFEVPEDTEEGTRLWLQPFGPQPNCYGTGTAEIRFGKKEISRLLYTDKFERQSSPLPAEALGDKGPAKYRVFYDSGEKRIIVQRNGREVGDWRFFDKKDAPADEANRNFQFNGLCFDREDRGQGDLLLKFNRLRVQPWDGTLPKEGEGDDNQDRLSDGEAAAVPGKLESVTGKELSFSGVQRPLQNGSGIRFSSGASSPLAGAEAKLELGNRGEFIARQLEVHQGKLHCETAFANTLELPLSALQKITFPAPSPAASPHTDMLVFKNGDEVPGKALWASLPGPAHWRMATGQELEIQPGRIAGFRLAGDGGGKADDSAATVELHSGERLRGKLLGLDGKQLGLEHPVLGAIALDRGTLAHLFPNPRLGVVDGGRTPVGWVWTNPESQRANEKKKYPASDHWVYLDGAYILRSDGSPSVYNPSDLPGLQQEINPALERFEVRVEAKLPFGLPVNFLLTLNGQNGTTLNATISYSELQVLVMNSKGRNQGRWREISLDEKVGNVHSSRAMRLFVDTKNGTCDIVINGVLITRLGQMESERLSKSKYTLRIQPYPSQGGPAIFSNLWIGPWNGELPVSDLAAGGSTALANGDVVAGTPKAIHDGKFTIDSDIGELDLPLEKALAVDFGGVPDQPRPAARLRLADDTIVNVDSFQWDGREWTAHSATLGDLRLPTAAVRELIYDPAPPHAQATVTKKLAKKDTEDNADHQTLR